jgi:hypothetical protein
MPVVFLPHATSTPWLIMSYYCGNARLKETTLLEKATSN